MSDLSDAILNFFPGSDDSGVPLRSSVTLTLSGLDYDADSISNGLFVEGPDTDQFIGPGLLEQIFPENISQGPRDDFLRSPGYQGIVEGTTTVSGMATVTEVTFTPTLPFAANTEYVVNLTGVTDSVGADIDGFVTWKFTSGSGSIEELPSTVSSSVLNAAVTQNAAQGIIEDFAITKTTPEDLAVEQPRSTNEIVVEFNKDIDPASVSADDISVVTTPATDHPNATTKSRGDLAKTVEVDGNKLKIKI